MTIAPDAPAVTAPPAARGFTSPETARQAAVIFLAAGFTPEEAGAGLHADGTVLAELAATMRELLGEGFTPPRCRQLTGLGQVPVPLQVRGSVIPPVG